MIIKTQNDLRRFLRSIEHLRMRKERKETFSAKNFIPENYQEILSEYHVKLELQ